MPKSTASPHAYALGALTVATIIAATVRGVAARDIAVRARRPAASLPSAATLVLPIPSMAPRAEVARRSTRAVVARGRFISIDYARSSDLMGYGLMMAGLSLVFVAVVHQTGFLLPIGLAWCAAAIAVAQLRSAFGSAGGLAFGLAGLFGGADAFAFALGQFSSVADFAPALFAFLGSLAATLFAALDLGDRGGVTIGRWKPQAAVALVALATLGVAATSVSAGATIVARGGVSATESVGATRIEMQGVRFEPELIRATSGTQIRLLVRNDDLIVHTFTIREANIDVQVPTGSERLIEFEAPAPGRYTYICTVPGHEDMVGGLKVE